MSKRLARQPIKCVSASIARAMHCSSAKFIARPSGTSCSHACRLLAWFHTHRHVILPFAPAPRLARQHRITVTRTVAQVLTTYGTDTESS